MSFYDYKIVPAPRRAKKIKGVTGGGELFALTLNDTINEIARQGWEYYCSESLTAETPGGWFKRSVTEEQVVLVFRKPREHLSPRLAAAPVEESAPEPARVRPRLEPAAVVRREPALGGAEAATGPALGPALGPAERS